MEQVMAAVASRSRSVDGVPTSLADLGYTDVGLDDGWQLDNSGPGGKGFHNATGGPIVDTTGGPIVDTTSGLWPRAQPDGRLVRQQLPRQ